MQIAPCKFVHSDCPSSRCQVQTSMAGFDDAALDTTFVAMDLVIVCLLVVLPKYRLVVEMKYQ